MNNKLFVMNMAFNDSTAEKGNTGNTPAVIFYGSKFLTMSTMWQLSISVAQELYI